MNKKILFIGIVLISVSAVYSAPKNISGGEVEAVEIRKPEIQFTSARKITKENISKKNKYLARLKKTNKKLY